MSGYDIRVLNDLIEITMDNADGYAEAARDARAVRYAVAFQSRASELRHVAGRLQHWAQALGGDDERGGSVLASMHRLFANVQRTMSAGNHALLAEVERGESYLRTRFEQALQDHALSEPTHAVIAEAYRSVKSGHEQMHLWRRAAASSR